MLKTVIKRAAEAAHANFQVIEKDYAIGYILAGIARNSYLRERLVFKGGTALKKLYFGNYRFSEDLDFSGRDLSAPEDVEKHIGNAVKAAWEMLDKSGPFSLDLERYAEKHPHPHGQEAFVVSVKYPWHPRHLCRIKVEISRDEPVMRRPLELGIIHPYTGEDFSETLPVYTLEEIVAEKLRALLQTHEKLVTRGWHRSRARDYYDLWRIFLAYGKQLDYS
ncbi:MAG: nucleotidyl transferase AbiEii/AbiGii toxin family protein, partial [Candidatus Cloacimonetes bacterium]|nr:nucleotidyl transferase AbiEii/AbiGii toxin family protein [Candidatus Cloacimonadota bacterium]